MIICTVELTYNLTLNSELFCIKVGGFCLYFRVKLELLIPTFNAGNLLTLSRPHPILGNLSRSPNVLKNMKTVRKTSGIDHSVLDMRSFSTRRIPLERARRQLSNGFCLVEKDLISRKLWHILDSDKIRQELFRIILH